MPSVNRGAAAWPRWRPSASATRLATDSLPSLVVCGLAAHEQLYNHSGAGTWLVAQVLAWSLLLRRRAPASVLAFTVVVAAVGWAAGNLLFAHLAVLVALHEVAARRPRSQALLAGAVVEVGAIMVAVRFAPTGSSNDGVVLLTGLVLTAVFLGTTQRTQAQYVEALRDRAERLEHERGQQARLAAATERTRIAREMHDIVAHSVAVMVTLSEGSAATAERDAGRAAESMRLVASTGRDAMAELRRVLTVLRDPDQRDHHQVDQGDPALTDPTQPRLDGLVDLVDDVRRAGLVVDLALGIGSDLPDPTQATVYRVVQESLTNVLKHAREATRVSVRVVVGELVEVLVTDDGHTQDRPPSDSAGSGLRGMAERAALSGGAVEAGPLAMGWQVRLTLPGHAQSARSGIG